jgi:ribosomal protein S18 acetylase RimI-like enzyme
MSKFISFREFQETDRPILEKIIRETWNYDRFCSPKTAERLARVYLSSCLADQTYTQVALIEDQPVGIIMAKNETAHRCPFLIRLKLLFSAVSLLSTREGRAVFQAFWEVEKIDQDLLSQCETYDGELAFFAVSKSCRGIGIGKVLFQRAVEYMNSQKISAFYLFTDTSCNYGFYEHQGMKRQSSKTYSMEIEGQTERFEFFLYDYHI